MPLILGTNSIKDTGYDVDNSLRFNSGSSDSLSKAFSSHGTRTKWTWSIWFKRSKLSGSNVLGACYFNDSNEDRLEIDSNGQMIWYSYQSNAYVGRLKTNRKFRDISCWYHLVLRWDTGDSTADNRMKIWINGVEETSFANRDNPSSDAESLFNYGDNSQQWVIGHTANVNHWGGYMAEIVFCDNQKLEPTSFGEFNSDSPTIWQPIDVSGLTFNTNGFYLDFEDSSALGNDVSGNNNDWTSNNFTALDSVSDTCTNNFCTLNSLDNYFAGSTFAEGNCKVTYLSGSGKYGYNTGTIALSSGKWYHEVKIAQSVGSNYNMFGLEQVVSASASHEFASSSTGYVLNGNNGTVYVAGSNQAYGSATAVNNIIGVYVDLDNNKLYFSINGTLQNSGTGISIATVSSTTNGHYLVIGGDYSSGTVGIHEFNFGGSPPYSISSSVSDDNGYGSFEYSPNITGDGSAKKFYAICTKNLAEYG